jgi:hypothetical protein
MAVGQHARGEQAGHASSEDDGTIGHETTIVRRAARIYPSTDSHAAGHPTEQAGRTPGRASNITERH